MRDLVRVLPAGLVDQHAMDIYPAPAMTGGLARAPQDADVLIAGIQTGMPSTQDLAVVAQTLISSGAERAGGRKSSEVLVQEPGFFTRHTRVAARVTSELEVWVEGRR